MVWRKGKVDEFDKMVLKLKNARDRLDAQAHSATKEANEYRTKAKSYLASGSKALAQVYLYREQQCRKYCETLSTFYTQTLSQLRIIQERKAQLVLKDTMKSVTDLLDGLLKYDVDDMRQVLLKNAEHAESAKDVMEAINQITPGAASEVEDMLKELEKELEEEKGKESNGMMKSIPTKEPAVEDDVEVDVVVECN